MQMFPSTVPDRSIGSECPQGGGVSGLWPWCRRPRGNGKGQLGGVNMADSGFKIALIYMSAKGIGGAKSNDTQCIIYTQMHTPLSKCVSNPWKPNRYKYFSGSGSRACANLRACVYIRGIAPLWFTPSIDIPFRYV
jgi:hypothetical protein